MTRPTPELKAAIVADRKAGMSQLDIAQKHGVSKTSVKRWAHGVVPEVEVIKPPRPVYTTEERRAILDDHYISGASINSTSDRHGIARDTLKRWIARDTAWIEDDPGADMTNGEWVLCPRRRVQVWRAA